MDTTAATQHAGLTSLLEHQSQILEQIARGASLNDVLLSITQWIEEQTQDVQCSILLFDEASNCLRHGSAPSLPESYNRAIDGITIGPSVGSCGTAAFRGEPVIVSDIATDPLWSDFADLALEHGLRACWSTPILSRTNDVLGTFALYYQQPQHPRPEERDLVDLAAHLASIVIERQREDDERRRLDRIKAADDEAARERQRLVDWLMLAPAAIGLLEGPDHIVSFANQQFLQLVGPQRDILQRPVRDALPETVGQGIVDILDRVFTTGERFADHEQTISFDQHGTGVHVQSVFDFAFEPVRTVDGQVGGIFIYGTDVTEHRQAKVAHSEAKARYRTLFNESVDAVLIASADGQYREVNPTAERLLGYESDELSTMTVYDLCAEDHDWIAQAWAAYVDEGRWNGEVTVRCKDGRIIPVEAQASTIQLSHETLYVTTLRDITERRALARLQQEFLAMVTHELKSPLTTLRGYAQLMQRRQTYQPDRIQAIIDQTGRLERVINDLLDASQIENHRLDLRRSHVDLVAVIHDAADQATAISDEHQIEAVTPDRPLVGWWDRDRLLQIFGNLMSNAIKYSPDGGKIRLVVEDRRSEVQIEVIDSGIGIAPEVISHLFQRFYRADSTRGSVKGIGLGLYITKSLVEAHGGTISVTSTVDQGSVFTVILPYD